MEGLVPAVAQWKKRKGDPAMVAGGRDIFEPARQMHRLQLLAREEQVRKAGLLDWDAFLDGHDNDRSAMAQAAQGSSRPTVQGSSRAAWLAFSDATLD